MKATVSERIVHSMFAGLLMVSMSAFAEEKAGRESDSSGFSKETAVLYLTSNVYDRMMSDEFPQDPVDFYSRFQEARALRNAGQCSDAVPLFSSLVREYQDNGAIWLLLGLCQESTGIKEDAIRSFKEALSLGTPPFDEDLSAIFITPNIIMAKIGWLHADLGQTEEAIEWLKRSVDARLSPVQIKNSDHTDGSLDNELSFRQLVGMKSEDTVSRDEQWRLDLDYLSRTIQSTHYDPDHRTPAAEINQAIQELKASINTLSDKQILARLSLIMGKFGAGHDFIFPGTGTRGILETFAIKAYFFSDGLYIIEAEDPALIGAKIDRIGDVPALEALEIMQMNMARDNNMTALWNAPKVLSNPWLLEAHNLVDQAENATFTITDREGNVRVVRPEFGQTKTSSSLIGLTSPAGTEVPLYLSDLNAEYFSRKMDSLDALYVQVNSIDNAENESFKEFSERVQREASISDIKHLILDLRHSPGGRDSLLPALIRVLVHFTSSPDKGELFVLIGRNTFSATQHLITVLDQYAEPIFVGEPSGSRPNFIGEVTQFVLPFSGISGSLSAQYYQVSIPHDFRIWIAPDIPVSLSSVDFFNGQDPAIKVIQQIIASQR